MGLGLFRRVTYGSALVGVALSLMVSGSALAQERVVRVTATDGMTTDNPHGDSTSSVNSIWCQVYGCLGRYDYEARKYVGVLAESWEQIDDTTWRFKLRGDLKRHDGGPGPTTADVIHSWKRVVDDPESVQQFYVEKIADIVVIDDLTFDIKTDGPAVNLIAGLFDRFKITSAELYAAHGREADKQHAFGFGPYELEEFSIDSRIVLRRSDNWPDKDAKAPDVVIYQMMREPEQRVTGLLNGEVQIARLIPPQLVERLESREDLQVMKTNTIEQMFVAFNNKMEPWTDVRIRRAAAMAINRPLIIDRLLRGLATPLVGMINEEQICYTGAADRPVPYDPEASKKLLAEAGYADGGPEIEFFTASGRYISDRQVSEAVTQMLEAVGFKVTLNTPEWANLWADVRAGKAPMYYMGRNSVHDPVDSMAQLFETDNTKRVGYSNPEFDRVLRESNTKFDPKERCALLREANQHLLDDVPAMFMWSHKLVTGVQAGLHVPISPTGEIWWSSVQVN